MCQLIREFLFYMNYKRIHDKIIARAKSEQRKKTKDGIYYEQHHIIPRCMGGDNSKENLVLLTAREHFLIHWLLAEIYNIDKLWYAFNAMIFIKNNKSKRYIPSSRVIEREKLRFSNIRKNLPSNFKGKQHSLETKKVMSDLKKGKALPEKSLFYLKLNQQERTRKRKAKDLITYKQTEQRKVLIFTKDYKLLKTLSQKQAAVELNIAESTLRVICSNQRNYKNYILTYNWYKIQNKRSSHQFKKVIEYLEDGTTFLWDSNVALSKHYNISIFKVIHFLNGATKQLKGFNRKIKYVI